jgi:formate-dependent nitrite reductase cytochrome c552 subunit
MKRHLFVALIFLATAGLAAAQKTAPTTDILGAHLNYGRGCAACHSPHSGAYGNGAAKTGDPHSGSVALWGEDVASLYGKTITTGGGKFVEVLPTSLSTGTPDVTGLLVCLSCHDGNYATGAMMKNKLYEVLPANYGNLNSLPTLLESKGGDGIYLNIHPVGLNAKITCGGAAGWDCTISSTGAILMTGKNSSKFVLNYGFFVSPGVYNNMPVVMCTTCHNQHQMNVVRVTNSSKSGLPSGNYATMFFIRAPYNPADANPSSNQNAQFCRQCHADKSNEMNGGTSPTVF